MEQTNSVKPEGIVTPAKKRAMPPKSKMTTYIMFGALALFIILFIIFFNVGDSFKAQFTDFNVKALNQDLTDEWKQYYLNMAAWAGARYSVFAFMSYLCSILALVSLGVGLAVSEKFKTMEESVAERE